MRAWPSTGLWRHPDFVKLWSAETISQLGTQVSILALPLLAILVLDASTFQVALLGTIDFLPFVLFSLPAGVWVDRLRRKPILVVSDLGRAVALLSIPAVNAFGELTIWQLYGVGFVVGTLSVFFMVTYQSYLPSLVERSQLVDGNSKLEVSRSGAELAGPGLAGALIGAMTAPYAVLVDAVSFVASAAFLFSIQKHEEVPATADREARAPMRMEVKEGIRYVFGDPRLRALALSTAVFNLFDTLIFAIFLVFLTRTLGLTPGMIGLVFALGNIGSVVGALTASRISTRFGVGPAIVGSTVFCALPLLLIPAAPRSSPIPFLVASGALSGFGLFVWRVAQVSLRQSITPDRLLGRVNSASRFVMWGTIPIGSLLGGVLGSTIGLRNALWVGAIGACSAFLPMLLSPIRTLVDVPPEEAHA